MSGVECRQVQALRDNVRAFCDLVGEDRIGFLNAIMNGAAEVCRPTFFSMLIIIVAHVPIFTLQRHEGRIFAPMAWTVTSALIGSLLFSLTLVPLLCWFLLRKNV